MEHDAWFTLNASGFVSLEKRQWLLRRKKRPFTIPMRQRMTHLLCTRPEAHWSPFHTGPPVWLQFSAQSVLDGNGFQLRKEMLPSSSLKMSSSFA